jgi:ribosome-binding ATPase YchF (GTP1/OBG family)
MDPLVLTSGITAVAAIIGGPAFATYITKRKSPSVASVAIMLQKERDRLQERLDTLTAEYDRKIVALKAGYEAELAELKTKQQQQRESNQAQLDELYRRLYRTPPPSLP